VGRRSLAAASEDWLVAEVIMGVLNYLNSSSSSGPKPKAKPLAGRLKVGTVAVASLLAGGLIAAWWYRKTLLKLRKAEEEAQNPHFGIPERRPAEED
jgi:hypothetical protein